MDIDNAKENIQPLASGRNISLLEAALHAETHQDAHRELMQKREYVSFSVFGREFFCWLGSNGLWAGSVSREFERRIAEYCGDDPLELWYDYILWIEQCYPKSGKQSAFDDVLVKCITTLENDEKYHQDRRMVKIYIKFVSTILLIRHLLFNISRIFSNFICKVQSTRITFIKKKLSLFNLQDLLLNIQFYKKFFVKKLDLA